MIRAGRRAFTLGFAALCSFGGGALPATAQSYLADSGGNVTVDYSVIGLGSGPGPVTRGPLPGGAMPAGTCNCATAPMGVIAAPPRPTFTNPFSAQVTQAPAVPPGFMAYTAVSGSSGSSGGAVVLREPSAPMQMAASAPEPVTETPAESLPTTTPTQTPEPGPVAEAEPALPATTPTQSEPSTTTEPAMAPSTDSTAPAAPEAMPTEVPSPVEQPPAAETPAETPAPETPAAETPAETQTAEAPVPETPAASSAATSTQPPEGEQQAAVAAPESPEAPAEATAPPAEGSGALPAGATRILYVGEADEIPTEAIPQLDTIVQEMAADDSKRIQVLCYAAGTEDTESKARRKSLARGLAIRSYLYKAGVSPTRIDVRALGNKAEGGPADRVDIVPAS